MIEVDIVCPERNREVSILPVRQIRGIGDYKKQEFEGYDIWYRPDPRFATIKDKDVSKLKPFFECSVFSDNILCLKIPACDYDQMFARKSLKGMSTNDKKWLDDARNNFMGDIDKRFFRTLYLKFPTGHRLTAKPIRKQDKNSAEKLPMKVQIVDKTPTYFIWSVVSQHEKSFKIGKPDQKEDEEKDESELLWEAAQNMKIEDDDADAGSSSS